MVEATTQQLNYTLNTKVTATTTGNVASGVIVSNTAGNSNAVALDTTNDFNLIASNCNTNICFFCQKTFTNVYNCRRHIRTHSGEKPFQCNVCGKKFSRQSTLNAHEKVHTGNQLFKCEVCGQAFDVYRHLTEHMAVHRIDKPFTCKICNKSYSRATVLSQHMKSHNNYNVITTIAAPTQIPTPIITTQSAHVQSQNNNVTVQPIQPITTTTTVVVSSPLPSLPPMPQAQEKPIPLPIITIPAPMVISQPMHKCAHCDKIFTSLNDLKEHELYHLVVQQEDKKIVSLKDVVVVVKQQEEPQIIQLLPQIKCYICNEVFNSQQECANHVQMHNRVQMQNNVTEMLTPRINVPQPIQPTYVQTIVKTPDEGIEDEIDENELITSFTNVEHMDVDKVTFANENGAKNCSCNVCGKSFKGLF